MKDNTIDNPFYLQIQREINRIEKKADLHTYLFYLIRVIQILFAGTITVISGLNNNFSEDTTIVLILGAITTAVTAIDTLFQVDAKKNTYKLVLFELRTIRAELVYKYIQSKLVVDGKKQIEEKVIEELFEKYRKANSYARDLIGTDNEKEPLKTETVETNQNAPT
ncbi:SLATT domain-containing protein [Flavobacterium chungangense]|uniref:SMODS and SLOG-associating 2TM effector domain-containing protein n=1 Tax=Flavobacterium chungangense TaxID=554283 RepID=A0A6V6YN16_9FLAO|nr:SLATT domain-containing protein [Flavobacterium chungangense]CAD0000769.1 hypothetical protein FLACHUCJ7_00205 [Flavobacterium chungangense]